MMSGNILKWWRNGQYFYTVYPDPAERSDWNLSLRSHLSSVLCRAEEAPRSPAVIQHDVPHGGGLLSGGQGRLQF